ncbi:hypothetical protein Tsumi_12380 [Porphyromonas miyakawae]|uniref:Uncharacterized protein n=1 Tax=Porphyromonas miyakawae TaxID=3137470 RepID=A0ABQ0E397_9PORP
MLFEISCHKEAKSRSSKQKNNHPEGRKVSSSTKRHSYYKQCANSDLERICAKGREAKRKPDEEYQKGS